MISQAQKIGLCLLVVGGVAGAGVGVAAAKESQQAVKATVITDYMRIWISSDTSNPIGKDSCVPGLWFHTGSGNNDGDKGTDIHVTTHSSDGYGSWNNSVESNRTYYYFDVPTTIVGNYMTIQRFSSSWEWQNQSNTFQITETVAKNQQVFFLWSDQTTISQGAVGSGSNSVDAGMAAKALEGLLTCEASAFDGYGAFANINSTFIMNGTTWKTSGELSSFTINDYANKSDYGTAANKTTDVNAYVKYTMLKKLAGV